MTAFSSKQFGDLLTEGIYGIQKSESIQQKKKVSEIAIELADCINRKATVIEWYRKNHIPTNQKELETLAQTIYLRGHMEVEWLEQFLKTGGHIRWREALDRIACVSSFVLDHEHSYAYKKNTMFITKQILPDGTSESFISAEIEATSDEPVGMIRNKVTNLAIPMLDFDVRLQQFHREDGGNVAVRILAHYERICLWAVEFQPPLSKGQKAAYAYKTVRKSFAMTRQEIESQYQHGLRKGNFEYWSLRVDTPIETLEVQLIFPLHFKICPAADGWLKVTTGSHEQRNELQRLLAMGAFSANFDQKLHRWMLQLKLADVRAGHIYELHWLPPL